MPAQRPPQEPKPPAALHGPAAEGADDLLAPAVRAELRGLIREAVWSALGAIVADLLQRGAGDRPQPPAQPPAGAQPPAEPEPPPPRPEPRAPGADHEGAEAGGRFPHPHGDLDLRGIPANVPSADQRRPRRGAGRRYYFLPAASEAPPGAAPAAGTKPG